MGQGRSSGSSAPASASELGGAWGRGKGAQEGASERGRGHVEGLVVRCM